MSNTYVTVAIPYVNADPHIGYAYELVQADIYARARRAAGDDVRFLGGTDDNALKNVLAAEAAGEPTRRFVDRSAARFQALAPALGLSFDDFIRTSADERHAPAVERIWTAVSDAGDLYRRHYQGRYCVGCERFYEPPELLEGRCPEHLTGTETVAEENWFFRLSRYRDHLEEQIASDELTIRPEEFRREVLAFLRSGLDDISVSRSVDRARGWGIPVPGDPSQVVYVWFDALTNYISALDFGRPGSPAYRRWWLESDQRIHVIGKGILRFHAVYWPAFLASAGLPPPTRIQVHPYLTSAGAKLSKSRGGSLDPAAVAESYGADALRWFFARDVNEVTDTDFTIERLVDRADDELANAIGNAVNRVVTLVHRHLDGRVPRPDALGSSTDLPERVRECLSELRLRDGSRLVARAAAELNADISSSAPWTIAADPGRRSELVATLGRHIGTARRIAEAMEPITPELSRRLLDQLGGDSDVLPPPQPTFTRIARTADSR